MKHTSGSACLAACAITTLLVCGGFGHAQDGLGVISNGIPSSVTGGSSPGTSRSAYGRYRYRSVYGRDVYDDSRHYGDWRNIQSWGAAAGRRGTLPSDTGIRSSYDDGLLSQHHYLVFDMQRALKKDGSYSGPIDGFIGPKTRAAIRAYQARRGHSVTGRVDDALLRSLGLK